MKPDPESIEEPFSSYVISVLCGILCGMIVLNWLGVSTLLSAIDSTAFALLLAYFAKRAANRRSGGRNAR